MSGAHRITPGEGGVPFVYIAPPFCVFTEADDKGVREVGEVKGIENNHCEKGDSAGADRMAKSFYADRNEPFF